MSNARGRMIAAKTRARVSATITRPDDTTAYTAGDAVADATSEPSVASIQVARANGGSGLIRDAQVVSSANQGTKADLEIWLFTAAPTAMEDNAAVDPTDAEMATVVRVLDMGSSPTEGNAGSGADGNVIYQQTGLDIPFECASGAKALYWIPVVRNAYSPVAEETFTLILGVEQD